MNKKTKSIITGMCAGLANGFFGSGGGLFVVPLLTNWIKTDERKAFATSIGIILPLSAVSAVTYFLNGSINFAPAIPFLVGGAIGGIISGKVFKKVPVHALRKAFALLIIYGGIRAVFGL